MGISSGRATCCSAQSGAVHAPASQRGHTATRAASCTYGQLPLARPSHRPDLPPRGHECVWLEESRTHM